MSHSLFIDILVRYNDFKRNIGSSNILFKRDNYAILQFSLIR